MQHMNCSWPTVSKDNDSFVELMFRVRPLNGNFFSNDKPCTVRCFVPLRTGRVAVSLVVDMKSNHSKLLLAGVSDNAACHRDVSALCWRNVALADELYVQRTVNEWTSHSSRGAHVNPGHNPPGPPKTKSPPDVDQHLETYQYLYSPSSLMVENNNKSRYLKETCVD